METILLSIVLLSVLATLAVVLLSRRRGGQDAAQERLIALSQALESVRQQVEGQLRETRESQERGQHRSQQVLDKLAGQLGEQREALRRVDEFQKDLKRFQEVLQPPKTRGGVGEVLLEQILKDILPKDTKLGSFTAQHQFRDGEQVDFVIRLGDLLIPIDAKFPKEAYEALRHAEGESEQLKARREFRTAVKRFIDSVGKYIRPDEGTSDFAFLYFPFESIYLAYLDDDDLADYAYSKRVVVVSPKSFYAYLQTILVGLRALQIEASAREVLSAISKLEKEVDGLKDRYRILGTHLSNASKAYNDAGKSLKKTETTVAQLAHKEVKEEE